MRTRTPPGSEVKAEAELGKAPSAARAERLGLELSTWPTESRRDEGDWRTGRQRNGGRKRRRKFIAV